MIQTKRWITTWNDYLDRNQNTFFRWMHNSDYKEFDRLLNFTKIGKTPDFVKYKKKKKK